MYNVDNDQVTIIVLLLVVNLIFIILYNIIFF